jgi:hypothetical protein
MRRRPQGSNAGLALAEVVVGMAIVVVALGMIFAMNGQLLSLLNQGKQSTYATQLIAERLVQLRTADWLAVTDTVSLESNLTKAFDTGTQSNLPGVTEVIHIEPYFDPAGRSMHAVRSPVETKVTGGNLPGVNLVKVSITVKWTSGKRERERQFVTVMSKDRPRG